MMSIGFIYRMSIGFIYMISIGFLQSLRQRRRLLIARAQPAEPAPGGRHASPSRRAGGEGPAEAAHILVTVGG